MASNAFLTRGRVSNFPVAPIDIEKNTNQPRAMIEKIAPNEADSIATKGPGVTNCTMRLVKTIAVLGLRTSLKSPWRKGELILPTIVKPFVWDLYFVCSEAFLLPYGKQCPDP